MFYYLALINEKKLNNLAKSSIEYVKEEVKKTTPFFSIVVFGSYSIQEEKKNSDLDIAIFIENKECIKGIKRNLKNAEMKSILKIDVHVITKEDMIEMLINDEENLGKQIARKHLAIYNHQLFYDLLKEGIKNGFKL